MWRFCALVLTIASISLSPIVLLAQEGLSTEQLKRMYDDAVVTLKSAQDRRNELAHENEKLQARLNVAEKQLAEQQAASYQLADSTYQIRAEHSAFATFLRENPDILVKWQLFIEKSLLVNLKPNDVLDREWPFRAAR